jgi:hypothetical protein
LISSVLKQVGIFSNDFFRINGYSHLWKTHGFYHLSLD